MSGRVNQDIRWPAQDQCIHAHEAGEAETLAIAIVCPGQCYHGPKCSDQPKR
jgi:hypothetical protein